MFYLCDQKYKQENQRLYYIIFTSSMMDYEEFAMEYKREWWKYNQQIFNKSIV